MLKGLIAKLKIANLQSKFQRLVMWCRANKQERYLLQNGWKPTNVGRWKSPKKDDFRAYKLKEALREEAFYWQTT